jgi:NAD(P)-dependent dehydrogenase (short-subunit alcohol dehydrogenase family)
MFKDKVAIITGASRGIGAAVARELAAGGASVVVTARDPQSCEAVAASIRHQGGKALAVACDVSDFDQVDALFQKTTEAFGGLQILVNNAGVIDPIARFRDSDAREWAQSISVNLVGGYYVAKSAIDAFTAPGIIVNVSSGAAHAPREGWSAYCAGKAGFAMVTQSIAHEIPAEEVRVYGYAPGTVDTEMQGRIRESGVNPISKMKREDHWNPTEPAKVIAWLCSPDAADLTGQELSMSDADLRRRAGLSR